MLLVYFFIFIFALVIAWSWANAIDYMKKNHPDYKGEDFLNWGKDKEDENNIY